MRRVALMCALLVAAVSANADDWRTYAGSFTSRWNTIGHHGHDQPACDRNCDASDFARGNLDDSIGFRAGRERDVWSAGALHLVGGADASVSHTEYNLSQRDFSLVSGTLFAGADVQLAQVRIGARYGMGGFMTTTTNQSGLLRSLEIAATLPLRRGAAVRISRRKFSLSLMDSAPSRDFSVTLVADGWSTDPSQWEFGVATGTTLPGAGIGGDRKLRSTALNRTSASRSVPWRNLQLEVSWTSTAHESAVSSMFRGYDGNFRSKTIEGYGIALSQIRPLTETLAMRWSAGFELADWRDEHRLLTRDGAELVAGIEAGLTAGAALRYKLQPRLGLETGLQKVYWRGIDLGEARWTMGIVLLR